MFSLEKANLILVLHENRNLSDFSHILALYLWNSDVSALDAMRESQSKAIGHLDEFE